MEISRCHDFPLIRKIMTHPEIYPHIADDGCPPADEFEPIQHPGVWHVLISKDREAMGLFMVVPRNVVCADIHTSFLPHARGEFAREAAARFLTWFWGESLFGRLIAEIPAYNKGAIQMAQHVGFKEFGVNRESFMRDGKLHDLRLFGISRPKVA